MNIFLYIKQAFSAIKSNKLRSFLSTLWIIIWIMSFVIMLAIWEWAKKQILDWISKDANVITVRKPFRWRDEWWKKAEAKNIYTEEVLNEISEKVSNVKNVSIKYNSLNSFIIYSWEQIYNSIFPVSKNYFEINSTEKILWTFFWEDDFREQRKVVIIWYKLIKRIFWEENPIWKRLNIWWELFIVSGVLAEKDWEFDYNIFMPKSTADKYFWKSEINEVKVYIENEKYFDKVKADLNYFLFKKSFVENFSDVDFELDTNKEFIKQVEESSNSFTYFLMFIWWISLLVWWIWIMNIMLVSVTERTREIWIRKAIWATNFTIMVQFLIESIILTLIGSFLAILFSYGVIKIIWSIVPDDFSMMRSLSIDTNILIIAISVSVSMWIIFGLMPAYKAARLKIIDALHFE